MWQILLLLGSLGCCLLGSTMLIASVCTTNWIIQPTLLGYYYEGLWNFCIAEQCMSLNRDWAYKVFVLGFLNVGTFSGFLCNLLSPLLWVCGKKEQIRRATFNSTFLSVVTTLIGMSVYTGKYTRSTPLEYRGWSFILAWCSFSLYLVAAFLRVSPLLFGQGCVETSIFQKSSPPTEVSAITNGHDNKICSNEADKISST
ncbi:lens fiber membrane intrinsic protein-like [Podarcis raffonei]|uniref:lens fiber membrane intrinsic protein-like n=1 Tax=Podarcis raffonei TaxID=65483 RepID=UPI00232923E3|nr:lens fiber membrane intrinsic protein-like [Podarcis raffonei]